LNRQNFDAQHPNILDNSEEKAVLTIRPEFLIFIKSRWFTQHLYRSYLKVIFWPNPPVEDAAGGEADKSLRLPCEMRSLFLWGWSLVLSLNKLEYACRRFRQRTGRVKTCLRLFISLVLAGDLDPKSLF
jgi:hypothetical protein